MQLGSPSKPWNLLWLSYLRLRYMSLCWMFMRFFMCFSAKYCNDRASQTNIPFLDPEMLELLEQAIKLGTPSLLPHLQRYTMLSKASLCFIFKYLQTVQNSTDRKGRHRNAGSLIIYKNYRDKTKRSDSSNKTSRILRQNTDLHQDHLKNSHLWHPLKPLLQRRLCHETQGCLKGL